MSQNHIFLPEFPTGNMTPILYLVEKYMADSETKRIAANAQLAKMLPEVMALIKAVQA